MMSLLPIGSVINSKGIDLIVCGYGLTDNKSFQSFYSVLVFPFGYTKEESILRIPINSDFKVISIGYKNEEYERVVGILEKRFSILEGITDKNITNVIEKIEKYERSVINE